MPNQIEIDVRADTSQARSAINSFSSDFRAAVEKAKGEVSGLNRELVDMGQKIAQAGQKQLGLSPSQVFGGVGSKEQQALAAYQASLERVTQKTKEAGVASETAGQRARAGFGGVEAMLERMAIRLIAIKLIYDTIRVVGDAVKQAIDWQAFVVQYQSFSSAAKNAQTNLESFQETAAKTGDNAQDIGRVALGFEMAGEQANQAARDANLVSEAAAAAHLPVQQLAKDFESVRLNRATIEQLREVAWVVRATTPELLKQVNALQQEETALRNIEPFLRRRWELERRSSDEATRAADAVEGFGQHLKLGDAILGRMAQGLSAYGATLHIVRQGHEVAAINLGAAAGAMQKMLAIGNQRILAEEGIGATALKQLERYGLIDASFVLSAYHRQVEDQRRRVEQAQEDYFTTRHLKALAAQLELQRGINKELDKGVGIEKAFADWAGTIEALWKRISQAVKQPPATYGPGAGPGGVQMQLMPGPETGTLQYMPVAPPGAATTPAPRGTSMLDPLSARNIASAIRAAEARNRWASVGRGIPAGYQRDIELPPMTVTGFESEIAGPLTIGAAGRLTLGGAGMPAFPARAAAIDAGLFAQGEAFRRGAGKMLVDLMKIGRHADYREAVRQGLIPDIQAETTRRLLAGGGTLDPSDPSSPFYSGSIQAQATRHMLAGGGTYGPGGQIVGGFVPQGPPPQAAARAPAASPELGKLDQIINILQKHYGLHEHVFGDG